MAMVDIQSLFADIIESPRQRQQAMAEMGQREAQIATNALSGRSQIFAPLVGALARNQGARDEMLQRSVGGLFGLDTRNESEKLQQMLSSAQTPEQQAQLPNTLRQMGYGQQAMALEQQLAEQARALEDRDRTTRLQEVQLKAAEGAEQRAALEMPMLMNQRIAFTEMLTDAEIPDAKKNALTQSIASGAWDNKGDELYKIIYPDRKDSVLAVGKGVLDLETMDWVVPLTEVPEITDVLSDVSPNQHDPASIAEFHRAMFDAYNVEGDAGKIEAISSAFRLLKDRAKDGYQWTTSYNENNEPVEAQVPMVGTPDYVAYRREVAAANAAAERVVSNSLNAIEVADSILNALETGEASTGIQGLALSLIPGTDEANVAASFDTLRAEMGISQLEAMRAASANGASGFGQLTQMELQRLEDRIRSLSRRQSRDLQIENVKEIRSILENAANRAKTDWTVDEWLGLTPRPFPSSPSTPSGDVTTSTGNRFTIVPVGAQ